MHYSKSTVLHHESLADEAVNLQLAVPCYAGCYVAAERNSKLEDLLVRHGLLARKFSVPMLSSAGER